MDNEVSAKFLHNITEVWKCKFQKVPPDMHRRNKAKRAIRTFKAHFITILVGKMRVMIIISTTLFILSFMNESLRLWSAVQMNRYHDCKIFRLIM
jgi:hypothetical protein